MCSSAWNRGAALCLSLVVALACAPAPRRDAGAALALDWERIEAQARGQTVTWAMWMGDPNINRYVEDYVRPTVRERYGIEIETVSAQGREILAMLMTELEARKASSEMDLLWINGENFHQLRRIGALLGPFAQRLPNARYIDFDDPFIGIDFQQPTDGFECPWGSVQFALIYDGARVPAPPRTASELADWIRANPGRFTIENGFTGMTLLKSLLIEMAGGPGSLDGSFDERRYTAASERLWEYLLPLRAYMWRRGETFPEQLSQLHQLYAAGEVDFTMSVNDSEVENKVLEGLFPETSRAYVLDSGTIRNAHFVGIAARARHVEGALVLANFLISPEAQLEKLKPSVWGDGTVLDVDRLEPPWPRRFRDLPGRRRAPPRDEMRRRALKEPAPETMIRIYEDFRARMIEGR